MDKLKYCHPQQNRFIIVGGKIAANFVGRLYYREKIDAIDKNITKLLASRFSWVKRIVHYKK